MNFFVGYHDYICDSFFENNKKIEKLTSNKIVSDQRYRKNYRVCWTKSKPEIMASKKLKIRKFFDYFSFFFFIFTKEDFEIEFAKQ